ncbi:UDP-2,3-diacylglucosamine diphosphatase [Marinimicrobium alkaliphilum]|uniref:UDP-2,3-diacylglucosamine diphosphatase n=1 Tax=Marinimicrobium alkaliphilum TaxID=2202654 RepID=UPI000DBA8703|nr:UDP-2,3-diacylglucosamine diphosphatase [Marinimicrobium alkaliphilum]
MPTLFISDMHLHESRPAVTEAFYDFLQTRASDAHALYILGDFFDAWIGDDDDSALATDVAKALAKVSAAGTEIFLMHGNRDFLIGHDYAKRCGASLIPGGTVIDLYGTHTLLMHGDELCTQDREYMAFRQQVRSPEWQQQILSQPLTVRRAMAQQLREQSASMNSLKAEDIMDVTPEDVVRVMRDALVTRMIHGHTHRPARHPLGIDGRSAERIVLGDWHDKGWCVYADEGRLELQDWRI